MKWGERGVIYGPYRPLVECPADDRFQQKDESRNIRGAAVE